MTCPKCKAKIGIVQQQITTDTGKVTGELCYMCGYWLQNFQKADGAIVLRSPVASELEAGQFL
ncbi:hypothetical protein JN12_01538 [Geobacter argillaceus]|uniref:AXH domain-containing protein n=1 Tax=Geobacter argillaceus TaxID=345631 RepID=A0A562VPT9_9BACT|nr:hypothetical protein JN12_01538 [Geobacter argillaceus]